MPARVDRRETSQRHQLVALAMKTYEIRDPGEARRHILQGLLLSRAASLSADRVASALAWGMEIVSDGSPLPPMGFVADVGQVAIGANRGVDVAHLPDVQGLDHTVTRRYEDYVLGKLYADISFQRGSDALLRYDGRDRNRGLAYLVNQLRRVAVSAGQFCRRP